MNTFISDSRLLSRDQGIGGEAPTCHQLQVAVIALSVILGFVLIGGLWLILHIVAKAHRAVLDAEAAMAPPRHRRPPYVAFYGNLGGTATTGGLTHGNGNRTYTNGHGNHVPCGAGKSRNGPPSAFDDDSTDYDSPADDKSDKSSDDPPEKDDVRTPPPTYAPRPPAWWPGFVEALDYAHYLVHLPEQDSGPAVRQHFRGEGNGFTYAARYSARSTELQRQVEELREHVHDMDREMTRQRRGRRKASRARSTPARNR